MLPAPDKHLPLFVAESSEQLEQLGRELVQLEHSPKAGEVWDSIFRRVHSIKGAAATLSFSGLVDVAHAAEALIGRLKALASPPPRALIDLLLEARDAMDAEVRRAARALHPDDTSPLPPPAPAELAPRLNQAAGSLPEPAQRAAALPSATQPAAAAAVDPSLPRHEFFVQLSAKCAAPGARAMILQRKLKAVGTLISIEPTPAQLMQTRGAARIALQLASATPFDELRKLALGVPEVESVELAAPVPAEAAAGAQRTDPPPARSDGEPRPEATVRVRAGSLDQVLEAAGEVLLGIARLRELARRLPDGAGPLEAEIDRLRRQARELHGRVVGARLTPLSTLTDRLPRVVRDLAHKLGKEVDLETEGADVELDRGSIEATYDPLIHLLRNAVDHGIEDAPERLHAGKPQRGRILIAARRERDRVLIEISDDGRGFDLDSLRRKAIEAGQLKPEAASALDDAGAAELAFLPGLSTRASATEFSGRGVGLDAVKRSIEGLGGKLSVRSATGRGTRFALELPPAVSMTNVLIVQVGGEFYGLPLTRVVLTTEYDLAMRGGEGFEARTVIVAGERVRAYGLAKLFGLPSLAPPGPRPFVVLEVDGLRFALAVDRLIGQEEALLRPLYPPLDRVRGLAGTTVLGNGRPLLVLDPRGLFDLAGVADGAQVRGAA